MRASGSIVLSEHATEEEDGGVKNTKIITVCVDEICEEDAGIHWLGVSLSSSKLSARTEFSGERTTELAEISSEAEGVS